MLRTLSLYPTNTTVISNNDFTETQRIVRSNIIPLFLVFAHSEHNLLGGTK